MKNIEIKTLKDQIKNHTSCGESVDSVETSLNDIQVLQMHKNKGHKRTSPGSDPETKTVHEEHLCKVCKNVFNSQNSLQDHIKIHNIHCDQCTFETDTKELLEKHMRLNHKQSLPMKCSFCPDTFIEKKNIIAHRKQKHFSYAPCRNINNCSFKEHCSFNHNQVTPGAYICFQCGNEYMSINNLMIHKKDHKKVLCKKFQTGDCDRNPCWFTHEKENQRVPSLSSAQNQVFPPIHAGQKPIIQTQTMKPDPVMLKIMEMMKHQQGQINQINLALQTLATNESTEKV